MSIICQICQQSFDRIIPWQHLKKHNITGQDYKKQFGSVYSQETLALFQSRTPHNKGKKVTDPEKLAKIKQSIATREGKYQTGQLTRHRAPASETTKNKISQSIKKYAQQNPNDMKQRAQKASNTRKMRGPIIGPMTGKKHSPETIEKLKKLLSQYNEKKQIASWEKICQSVQTANLTVLATHGNSLSLQCQTCQTQFSYTKQYFNTAKFHEDLCPKCHPYVYNKTSAGQQELFDYVVALRPDAVLNHRPNYHDPEIDIFIPELKLGFEFNGLYWHSETVLLSNNKSPRRDYEKQQYFAQQGLQLIQIYEDEWQHKQDIIKSRISNILRQTNNKIFARQCSIKELDTKTARDFFQQTHLMQHGRSNFRVGLFYQDQLVSAMSFCKNNLSRKIKGWELNRFASRCHYNVIGAASKLFQYFVRQIDPNEIVSYSDNRWGQGNLYDKLGFEKISNGTPNYWYFLPNQPRIHRFNLKKTINDNPALTEIQNRRLQGYNRIWDCGSSKWLWKKQ